MKNNLGKILTILIFLFINVDASEYRWSASINKKKAYVNEAVHLHYRCEFNSRDELHVIEFNPVGEFEDYDIHLLSESEHIVDSKRINEYEFVAFVKRSGLIEFNFDVLMKKTNSDSIENTVLGRDNADYEQFTKKLIKQKKLSIEVEESNSKLVGSFEFKINKDKPEVDAFEPFNIEIVIEGIGNLDKLQELKLNIAGAKVFASKAKKRYILTKDGYKGRWSQKFAIVSSENFDFPKVNYSFFNKNSNKVNIYNIDPFSIQVKKLYKKEELLDELKEDKPFFKMEYLYYILIFISGFLLGKIKIKKDNKELSDNSFNKKVQECKTVDELMVLLVINNKSQYSDVLNMLETKQVSLSQAKKTLIL